MSWAPLFIDEINEAMWASGQALPIQLFSSFLPRAAGEQKEERADGLAALPLGAPFTKPN